MLVERKDPVNLFNSTSWVVVLIAPTDCHKLVHNRCVIEVLVAFFELSLCFLDFSFGIRVFVIALSQIFSFSTCITKTQQSYLSDCYYFFL